MSPLQKKLSLQSLLLLSSCSCCWDCQGEIPPETGCNHHQDDEMKHVLVKFREFQPKLFIFII